jgi:hypothetical protein
MKEKFMEYEFFVSAELFSNNFKYPETYITFINLDRWPDIAPWNFYSRSKIKLRGKLEKTIRFFLPRLITNWVCPKLPGGRFEKMIDLHYKGLKDRYPQRTIVPFARKIGNDDVACFEASSPSDDPEVLFIHDWAGAGYELRGKLKNFSEWLEFVSKGEESYVIIPLIPVTVDTPPDAIADIRFYPSDKGGYLESIPAEFVSVTIAMDDRKYAGNLYLSDIGPIHPGDSKQGIPIKFTYRSMSFPKVAHGKRFYLLNEQGYTAEGIITKVNDANAHLDNVRKVQWKRN